MQTSWPSPVNDEITQLETEIHACFDTNSPIDPQKVTRLCDLRIDRMKELVDNQQKRFAIMQEETRKMTGRLVGLKLDAKPDVKEKLFQEQDKFNEAALHWVGSETTQWGESEAASIAAGILILAAQ
jgi:hypothetical protein